MSAEDIHSEEREALLLQRQQSRYVNKSRQVAAKYLQKLESLPGVPVGFRYFKNILDTVFFENRTVRYAEDEIFVGTFCVMMSQELIYAAGARPLKLCSGNYAGFQFGDDVVPRDACPLVKSVIGNNLIGGNALYEDCSMYIVPVSCDCKKKMASMISDYKKTMVLHVPLNKTDDDAMEIYVRRLKEVSRELESLTGKKITRKALYEQIQNMAEAQKEIRRFLELKSNPNLLIRGSHAMAILNTMAYDDISHWTAGLSILNDELELRKQNSMFLTQKKLPRILITGSPITFPNLKIPLLIEELGGIVAADETCIGDRGLSDPVSISENTIEGYYRALANRYVASCSCPMFSNNEQRLLRLESMVKQSHIDGIIYHVLRGCLVYDYEYPLIEEHFAKKGIPVIRLESDYNEEDVEQLKIRIEAFIEMIKFRHN